LISGTASIAPEGHSVHVGDVDAQTRLTFEVAEAILASRGMGWGDVTRLIAYFKCRDDVTAFDRGRAALGIPEMPVLFTANDICRDDLLFEIELDAVVQTEG
jgi:enamine deaminase RidA (YjgF/YER057c/UK114 family)